MAKTAYRIPLIHFFLGCLASLMLGLGIGLTYRISTASIEVNQPTIQPSNYDLARINPSPSESDNLVSITVYFNNHNFNPEAQDCAAVYPVVRKVYPSNVPIESTLNQLFLGPTEQEKSLGYDSIFSEKTKDLLKSASFKDGAVTLDLKKVALLEAIKAGANSSCGSAQYASSIQKTLLGIKGVKSVLTNNFTADGNNSAYKDLMAQ